MKQPMSVVLLTLLMEVGRVDENTPGSPSFSFANEPYLHRALSRSCSKSVTWGSILASSIAPSVHYPKDHPVLFPRGVVVLGISRTLQASGPCSLMGTTLNESLR